jgi:hypothetical protein
MPGKTPRARLLEASGCAESIWPWSRASPAGRTSGHARTAWIVTRSRIATGGGFMRFIFAFVAVFISSLWLGFALNPDNREELNRGFEMLRKVGSTQLSYIH